MAHAMLTSNSSYKQTNLRNKNMLNLVKDSTENLGSGVTSLQVGLGWQTSQGKSRLGFRRAKNVDLDLDAVALERGTSKRICWFNNEDAFEDGSLMSLGDNQTGNGKGDDETIIADLSNIPRNIDTIVFIVAAYKEGVTFSDIEGVDLRLYNGSNGTKLGNFMVDINSRHNAIVACKAQRVGDEWSITVINETGNARSRDGLLLLAQQYA
jgi:stress response protein SCP2